MEQEQATDALPNELSLTALFSGALLALCPHKANKAPGGLPPCSFLKGEATEEKEARAPMGSLWLTFYIWHPAPSRNVYTSLPQVYPCRNSQPKSS